MSELAALGQGCGSTNDMLIVKYVDCGATCSVRGAFDPDGAY